MKTIAAAVGVLVIGLVVLWRAARPSPTEERARVLRSPAEAHTSAPTRPREGTRDAAAPNLGEPPGGVRPWSPTAVPTDGPDPFAPVPQIRTAEDTRAGLAD